MKQLNSKEYKEKSLEALNIFRENPTYYEGTILKFKRGFMIINKNKTNDPKVFQVAENIENLVEDIHSFGKYQNFLLEMKFVKKLKKN